MKFFAALALALCSRLALASCPPHPLTEPGKINLEGDSVLIVTHASRFYDARLSSKRGIDEAVKFAKASKIPVIYLQDGSPEADYYMEDCSPDYWVFSENGEISFEVKPTQVYIAGGHLEKCMYTTVKDLLTSWAKQPAKNLTLTYFMDAVYSNGEMVRKTDPYYRDFEIFMRAATRGRPGGDYWPKLNLLETMGVINKEEHELEFLSDAVPEFEKIMPPGYRVELQMNNSVLKVLQAAPGWHPPILKFRFVDSALKMASPRILK